MFLDCGPELPYIDTGLQQTQRGRRTAWCGDLLLPQLPRTPPHDPNKI
ncbi:hypothetical protein Taro_045415 [Colocasia esculenta]|uniref:Uncharacterized protein n=1 Tax=Colocasia esculenta TaxID=4460 RepID=A0A843X464_COLES|nr:hypothetical protein [Colocasia esculenta]